jgi:hypothetical protein
MTSSDVHNHHSSVRDFVCDQLRMLPQDTGFTVHVAEDEQALEDAIITPKTTADGASEKSDQGIDDGANNGEDATVEDKTEASAQKKHSTRVTVMRHEFELE